MKRVGEKRMRENERVNSVEQKSNPINSTLWSNPESGTSRGTRHTS